MCKCAFAKVQTEFCENNSSHFNLKKTQHSQINMTKEADGLILTAIIDLIQFSSEGKRTRIE